MYRKKKCSIGKTTYSLKKKALWYWIRILVMFSTLLLLLVFYISSQLKSNIYQSLHQSMDLYVDQLDKSTQTVERCLWEFANNNPDVVETLLSQDVASAVIHETKTARLLDNTLTYLKDVDGMFVFGKYNNRFVCRYRDESQNTCASYLKSLVRSSVQTKEPLETTYWYYMKIGSHSYLIRVINDLYGYLGAWITLDSQSVPFENTNTLFLYADADGNPLGNEEWASISLSTDFSRKTPFPIRDTDGKSYLQVVKSLPFSECTLNALVPSQELNAPITRMFFFLFLGSTIIFLISLFWTISYDHLISKPLKLIQQMASQVKREQQMPHPDLSNERCEEVLEIGETLDKLMNRIEKLKIDVYEENLNLKSLELQYLKSQVAPHFLINCLSAIGSMPCTQEGKALENQFIRTLSDHLRYTMQNKKSVPLREELKYVENYLQLTELRFPGCLKWEIQVSDACMNASVFPIVLLMITENTIKHNMIMGEELRISICGHMETKEGEPHIILSHLDSGSGFSEETLQYINLPVAQQKHDIDGHKIGTYNIVKRISLIYGEKAHVHFSNEPGWGAKTEIDIPYIPYTEKDDFS